MQRVLGIDEAGRGCVLGDLVIAGFLTVDPDEMALREAGAADSKAIKAKKRLEIRDRLSDHGEAMVRRVTATEIDGNNLNHLEEAVIIELVRECRPDVVLLDALGHPSTLPALERRLQRALPDDLQPDWVIEPKADSTYAVVGAASIFAKTVRDELLDDLRGAWGELGSGYPGDPKTKGWLETWADSGAPWPAFVRTRWATVTSLAQRELL